MILICAKNVQLASNNLSIKGNTLNFILNSCVSILNTQDTLICSRYIELTEDACLTETLAYPLTIAMDSALFSWMRMSTQLHWLRTDKLIIGSLIKFLNLHYIIFSKNSINQLNFPLNISYIFHSKYFGKNLINHGTLV